VFSPERLHLLTAADFKSFLRYEHNRHWWGIHRHETRLVADMDRLRWALGTLLDQSQPLERRLDEAARLPGLGKAVLTPILLVVYPTQYGVWNAIAERAMHDLAVWPSLPGASSFGRQYVAVNTRLLSVADAVPTDLWTLDALWWAHSKGSTTDPPRPGRPSATRGDRAVATDVFVCGACFATKASHLRSTDPDRCVDCA